MGSGPTSHRFAKEYRRFECSARVAQSSGESFHVVEGARIVAPELTTRARQRALRSLDITLSAYMTARGPIQTQCALTPWTHLTGNTTLLSPRNPTSAGFQRAPP
jgi:hypothetical protein